MEELARSPELELEAIRGSVKKIRERERYVAKKYFVGKYLTYWDADESRVFLYDTKARMSTEFGQDIILTGAPGHKETGVLVFDVDHIVALQFCPKEHLKTIFEAQSIFKPDGGLSIGDFSSEGLASVKSYCEKIDKTIKEEGFKLRDQGVKNIFGRMYTEMGGDQIPKEDRVGRRVKFFSEVAAMYNSNKEKWKPLLLRLGLLGK